MNNNKMSEHNCGGCLFIGNGCLLIETDSTQTYIVKGYKSSVEVLKADGFIPDPYFWELVGTVSGKTVRVSDCACPDNYDDKNETNTILTLSGNYNIYRCKTNNGRIAFWKKNNMDAPKQRHAYWIPSEYGCKCSMCETEYLADDAATFYECHHCHSQMGEPDRRTYNAKLD